ncbi:MAG: ubiquitin-like protein Pup [bacterium]|nr:ubiquitin-like protein Pup [bacterium]
MAERLQKRRETSRAPVSEVVEVEPVVSDEATKVKADLDALLDEIDEVLEINAEAFVKAYVQKGGE